MRKFDTWIQEEYKINDYFIVKGNRSAGWFIVDSHDNIIHKIHNRDWLYFRQLYVPRTPTDFQSKSLRSDLYLVNYDSLTFALYKITATNSNIDVKILSTGLGMTTNFFSPNILISSLQGRDCIYYLTNNDELQRIYPEAVKVRAIGKHALLVIEGENKLKAVISMNTLQQLTPFVKIDYVTVIGDNVVIMQEDVIKDVFRWIFYNNGKEIKCIEFNIDEFEYYDYDTWLDSINQMKKQLVT